MAAEGSPTPGGSPQAEGPPMEVDEGANPATPVASPTEPGDQGTNAPAAPSAPKGSDRWGRGRIGAL
eukprot:2892575-Alexandrium_andersonii.AAC.1